MRWGGWSRSFGYDQYGNGWVSLNPAPTGIGYGPATPAWNVYNANNQTTGSPYDAAGNMLALPPGMSFSYDAENRQVTESNSGGLSATYYCDADNHRVAKALSNGQKIVYVYDALGKLAAEYDWQTPGAPPCVTCYLTYDHLGSLRMVTDASANVIARHDYLPFGDEVPGGVAGRSMQFGAWDNASQRFTGKERDTETSLDYFGARYYALGIQRFMSADASASPDPLPFAMPGDPQTLNLYAYVRNNPLGSVDPDGHDDHVARHKARGDYKNWGRQGAKARAQASGDGQAEPGPSQAEDLPAPALAPRPFVPGLDPDPPIVLPSSGGEPELPEGVEIPEIEIGPP